MIRVRCAAQPLAVGWWIRISWGKQIPQGEPERVDDSFRSASGEALDQRTAIVPYGKAQAVGAIRVSRATGRVLPVTVRVDVRQQQEDATERTVVGGAHVVIGFREATRASCVQSCPPAAATVDNARADTTMPRTRRPLGGRKRSTPRTAS